MTIYPRPNDGTYVIKSLLYVYDAEFSTDVLRVADMQEYSEMVVNENRKSN